LIKLSSLTEVLPQCCEIDSFPISLCFEIEGQLLKELLPEGKTVIILAHHVKHSLEWAWFPLESERNNVNCAADLHLKYECERIVSKLEKDGYHSFIIPYPGRSGIRFKDLANKSGLGKIGDNFMFLHKEWGTWTHLRVIISDAEISDNLPTCEEVCNHCGICMSSCPANVIRNDILLGVECGEYQDKRDADIGIQGSYVFKCEECARACLIGTAPERITITK
jgi:epoxyqueuosine reductase QueG